MTRSPSAIEFTGAAITKAREEQKAMATDNPETLVVSTEWLGTHLYDPELRILDGSWHLPAAGRDAKAEYEEARIPGAQFFDIDEIADADSDLPHMVPGEAVFESWMNEFSIGSDNQVVVYDASGLFSAPRVRWLLRHMGLNNVAVLDGGLPKWRAERREVETGPKSVTGLVHGLPARENDGSEADPAPHRLQGVAEFKVHRRLEMVCDKNDVKRACATGDTQILDGRPAARFKGEAPEPRPGLRLGHMPGAINVPFTALLNPNQQTLKESEELRAVLEQAGFDFEGSAITSCGSGVAAAVVSLALELLGHEKHSLYDGSWSEWGRDRNTEVVVG